MRYSILLCAVLLGGCSASSAALVAALAGADTDNHRAIAAEDAYRKQKKLAEAERQDRMKAHKQHLRATRLQYELRDRRRRIDREVAREVRAELEQDSPLAPGAVVALMPLESVRFSAEVTDTVDALMFLELSATERFQFVARGDVEAAGRAMTREACAGERCTIEIGHALAAEQLLVPQLFVGEETCRLSLSLYDLRTETGVWAATVAGGCDDTSLRRAVSQLASQLAAPVVPSKRKPLQAATQPPERPERAPRQPFRVP